MLSVLSSGINCGSAPPDVRVAAARPSMGRVEDSPLPGAGRLLAADSGSMHRLKATAASEWSWAELGPGSSREAVTGQPQTIATHTLTRGILGGLAKINFCRFLAL